MQYGQQLPVTFLNAGSMYVHANTPEDTVCYISGSVKTIRQAITFQGGVSVLTGSFYHDAFTHAFDVDAGGWGVSPGKIVFADDTAATPGLIRYIRTEHPADLPAFDRSKYYVAFPRVLIDTNDTISVAGRMGLDVVDLHRAAGKAGCMVLRSEGDNTAVHDASLRIGSDGKSHESVDAGSVIVERDLSPYRFAGQSVKDYPLFAFASPMVGMKSGYFAGNWVRKLKTDDANHGHVRYVYGNESANGVIIKDQYLWNPQEAFETGKAYLVKARPAGFDYGSIQYDGGLSVTGASASFYDKGKFVFDGNIYEMQKDFKEQLFAGDTLFCRTAHSPLSNTVNWIIGNSWTSAICADSLAEAIARHPGLVFEPSIYVWPAGSATYQRYILPTSAVPNPVQVIDLKSIPSQSLLMIRILSDAQAGKTQSGTFTLTKRAMQTHSNAAHNTLKQASLGSGFEKEVLFKLSPAANTNLYDLAAVALRPGAQQGYDAQDMSKMYMSNSSSFLLYSLSTDKKRLAANVVPEGTESVRLCVHPGDSGGNMTLSASRLESIGEVWLEDMITGEIIDLKAQHTYTFTADPKDTAERFTLHFTDPFQADATGMTDPVRDDFFQCYYDNGALIIKGLKEKDLGSAFYLTDMQGRIVRQDKITQTPEMNITIIIDGGIYVAQLRGNRNIAVKFVKGDSN
jgi:hypothetical protein